MVQNLNMNILGILFSSKYFGTLNNFIESKGDKIVFVLNSFLGFVSGLSFNMHEITGEINYTPWYFKMSVIIKQQYPNFFKHF
jgi:hypothetical protein